MFNFIIANLL